MAATDLCPSRTAFPVFAAAHKPLLTGTASANQTIDLDVERTRPWDAAITNRLRQQANLPIGQGECSADVGPLAQSVSRLTNTVSVGAVAEPEIILIQ